MTKQEHQEMMEIKQKLNKNGYSILRKGKTISISSKTKEDIVEIEKVSVEKILKELEKETNTEKKELKKLFV